MVDQTIFQKKTALLTDLCAQALDFGCIKSLLSNTKTLRQIHEEALSLLKMFWRAALPGNDRSPLGLKKVGPSLWLPRHRSMNEGQVYRREESSREMY